MERYVGDEVLAAMSRRLAHTAAVALTALACGLGAAACGGASADDKAAQARWEQGVPRWHHDMVTALNQISVMLSSPRTVENLHKGSESALAQLDRYETRLEGCADAIDRLGEAPGDLEPVRKEAVKACHALTRGAGLVRDGVRAWQIGMGGRAINRANTALGNGQRMVERVRMRLRDAVSG
jgi:hypothetical protein